MKNDFVNNRKFLHCLTCDVIFVPQEFHFTPEQEKSRYETHQNSNLTPGYREFLMKFIGPLWPHLPNPRPVGFRALDFGSGPSPALQTLLAEKELMIETFDPYFTSDTKKPVGPYDLLCSTEVVEHFRDPLSDWKKMVSLVKPGGLVAVMTQFHFAEHESFFQKWWYVKDPTHVVFYSQKSFAWLAKRFGLKILFVQTPVFITQVIPFN